MHFQCPFWICQLFSSYLSPMPKKLSLQISQLEKLLSCFTTNFFYWFFSTIVFYTTLHVLAPRLNFPILFWGSNATNIGENISMNFQQGGIFWVEFWWHIWGWPLFWVINQNCFGTQQSNKLWSFYMIFSVRYLLIYYQSFTFGEACKIKQKDLLESNFCREWSCFCC